MRAPLHVEVLTGDRVRLEPLGEQHIDALTAAAAEDRASYAFTQVPASRDEMVTYVAELLAAHGAGETVPFVQARADDGMPVGVTRYLTMRFPPGGDIPYAVEIGGTWLSASAQRSGINIEAKLLLLTYAFEVWRVARVDLKTDARNQRSRTAIAALGAEFEGVLRSWQPSLVAGEEGLLRNTAMYSILASEWDGVRTRLRQRLG